METYDLFMILILGAAALFGFWKGFAWQVASVASIVLSYIAALRFSGVVAPKLTEFGFAPPLNKFAAMLLVYVATSAAIWMLFRMIRGFLDRVRLNEFDHQLGALLGIAKGALWCTAITFFAVTLLPQQKKEDIIGSRSGRAIVAMLDNAESVLPPEYYQMIRPYVERARQPLVDPNYQPELPFQQMPGMPNFEDLRGYLPNQDPQAMQQQYGPPQNEYNYPQQEPRQFPGLPYSAGQPAQTNPY